MIQKKELLPGGAPQAALQAPTSAAELRHLNQSQLARRWSLSERTLERWRWRKQGPPYIKLGGHVVYRLEDIEWYEQLHVRGVKSKLADRAQ